MNRAVSSMLILSKDIGDFNMTMNYAKSWVLDNSKCYVLPAVQLPLTVSLKLGVGKGMLDLTTPTYQHGDLGIRADPAKAAEWKKRAAAHH